MRRVFLDTIGLLALWNARDQWHEQARQTFLDLSNTSADLWTSSYVLLECANAAARTPFRREVVELRGHLLAAGRLLEPTTEETEMAWTAYSLPDAAGAGIVDHVSFVLMRREGINEVFSNDRHFRAAGFTTLI